MICTMDIYSCSSRLSGQTLLLCCVDWVRWEMRDVCLCLLEISLKFKSWQVNTPNVQVCSPCLNCKGRWGEGEPNRERKKKSLCVQQIYWKYITVRLFCQIKHATYFHIYSIENMKKDIAGFHYNFIEPNHFFLPNDVGKWPLTFL